MFSISKSTAHFALNIQQFHKVYTVFYDKTQLKIFSATHIAKRRVR